MGKLHSRPQTSSLLRLTVGGSQTTRPWGRECTNEIVAPKKGSMFEERCHEYAHKAEIYLFILTHLKKKKLRGEANE